jgi:hypothetical protein
MIIRQHLITEANPGIGQPVHPHRRTFLGGALGALLASSPARVMAEDTDAPSNPFIPPGFRSVFHYTCSGASSRDFAHRSSQR